jgi:hypothetical protein
MLGNITWDSTYAQLLEIQLFWVLLHIKKAEKNHLVGYLCVSAWEFSYGSHCGKDASICALLKEIMHLSYVGAMLRFLMNSL